jgi:hypothetical protein
MVCSIGRGLSRYRYSGLFIGQHEKIAPQHVRETEFRIGAQQCCEVLHGVGAIGQIAGDGIVERLGCCLGIRAYRQTDRILSHVTALIGVRKPAVVARHGVTRRFPSRVCIVAPRFDPFEPRACLPGCETAAGTAD